MYTVYILFSKNRDRYYIGSTADVDGRLKRHNTDHAGYTGHSGDWKLLWKKVFDGKFAALEFERKIKSWKSRKMIEKLIGQGT
jgi:putative endonuclease